LFLGDLLKTVTTTDINITHTHPYTSIIYNIIAVKAIDKHNNLDSSQSNYGERKRPASPPTTKKNSTYYMIPFI
jgi:hypothetical protein